MNMNRNPAWVQKKADQEDGCIVSVGETWSISAAIEASLRLRDAAESDDEMPLEEMVAFILTIFWFSCNIALDGFPFSQL